MPRPCAVALAGPSDDAAGIEVEAQVSLASRRQSIHDAAFDHIDADGDGFLDSREIVQHLIERGLAPSAFVLAHRRSREPAHLPINVVGLRDRRVQRRRRQGAGKGPRE